MRYETGILKYFPNLIISHDNVFFKLYVSQNLMPAYFQNLKVLKK